MAEERLGASFSIDVTDLKAGLAQANRLIRESESQFKSAAAGLDDWTKSEDGLNAKIKSLNDITEVQKKKVEALKSEYESLVKNGLDPTSREAVELRTKINNEEAALTKNEKAIQDNEEALKDLKSGTKEAGDEADKAANGGFTVLKGVLANLASEVISKAVGALKDLASNMIDVGMTFDSSMSQVAAVSGATGDELEALRQKAQEMGASTKFTASEAADAFNYMAMAGWKTEDMLSGIDGILQLAAASGSDLATASDIVTDALTAMGYSAADAGRLANVMAAASSNANTNVEMMGATFQYAAPVAGALGYNMEDTAVAIGLMANAGIKGEKAGTALRSIMTRLSTDAGASSKQLGALGILTDELGVEFYNLDGTTRDLSSVISESREAWKDLTEEQQVTFAKQIAGQEAMAGWLALMNAADEDVDKLTDAVANSSFAIDDVTKALKESGVEWEKYADSAWNEFGDGIDGLTDEILYNIRDLGTSAEDLAEYLHFEYELDTEDAYKAIEAVTKAMGEGEGAAKQMADTMMNNLGGDITILNSAWEGFNLTLYDMAQGSMREVVQQVTNGVIPALQDMVTGAEGADERLGEAISGLVETIMGIIESSLPAIATVGIQIIETIAHGIIEALPAIMETAVTVISELCKSFVAALPELLSTILEIVVQVISALADLLPEIVDAIMAIVPQLIDALVEAIPQLIEAAIKFLMAIVQAIPTIITALIENLPHIITTIIDALVEAIPQLVDGAIQLFMAILDAIPVIIDALIENLPTIIEAIINGLIKGIGAIIKGAIQLFMGIIQAIPKFIPELIKRIPDIIKAIVDGLAAGFGQIVEAGGQLVSGIWEGIKSKATWLWDQISGWAGGLVNDIAGFFGIHSPSKVMEDLIGKNLALGIGVGFDENMDKVNRKIMNALQLDDVGINARITGASAGSGNGKSVVVYQTNNYSQAHSRYEIYKSKQQTMAAVQLALAGV